MKTFHWQSACLCGISVRVRGNAVAAGVQPLRIAASPSPRQSRGQLTGVKLEDRASQRRRRLGYCSGLVAHHGPMTPARLSHRDASPIEQSLRATPRPPAPASGLWVSTSPAVGWSFSLGPSTEQTGAGPAGPSHTHAHTHTRARSYSEELRCYHRVTFVILSPQQEGRGDGVLGLVTEDPNCGCQTQLLQLKLLRVETLILSQGQAPGEGRASGTRHREHRG